MARPSSNSSTLTLTYYPESGGELTETRSLDSFKGLYFHDIVLETFGLSDSKGMLIAVVTAPAIEVRARVYNTGKRAINVK